MRTRWMVLALICVLLPGCGPDEETGCTGDEDEDVDADGDGYCTPVDCADDDPDIHPDAEEVCNDLDDNCNGGLAEEELTDEDEDGVATCLDCEDDDPDLFPGNPEICDGLDQDCDDQPGEDEVDVDADGWLACAECADDDPAVHPDAEELACDGLDNDCDTVQHADDLDGDGDGSSACEGDCAPKDPDIHVGADEACDGVDGDCDGVLPPDEADADADGTSECDGDCDDADPAVSPDAEEVCDGIDNNCDSEFYVDPSDGTGETTDVDGDGFAPCMGDCEDEDEDVGPGAYDILGSDVDANCDGIAGGLSPSLQVVDDDLVDMLAVLEATCALYSLTLQVADFEDGTSGAPVGLTQPGLTFTAAFADTTFGYFFADLATGWTGFDGSELFARAESGLASAFVSFDVPQTHVIVTVGGFDASQSDIYGVALHWEDGLVDEGSFFGVPPAEAWQQRGLRSLNGVAFDTVEISLSVAPSTLYLDDLYYCR